MRAYCTEGDDALLVMENAFIRRTWRWNGGRISTTAITDLIREKSVHADGKHPDLALPGLTDSKLRSASFCAEEKAVTNLLPRHIEAVVETVFEKGSLRQVFRLFETATAIEMILWMKSEFGIAKADSETVADTGAIENTALLESRKASIPVMDRVPLNGVHWAVTSVEFRDATDRCNNLVEAHRILPYRSDCMLTGNILLLSPLAATAPTLFVVKESPCGPAQLDWWGHDFVVRLGQADVRGCGFTDETLEGWIRGYGCAVGVSGATEAEQLMALRQYQKCLRQMDAKRDNMVMMNTWGDRGRDGRLCEAFALAEIAIARDLGVTHFQLDDGWQQGLSHNSAFAGGEFPDLARMPDFWDPHPERFPNGLDPVLACGCENGVEICLWFNPSSANDYASWQRDAEIMISLHRQYGIVIFKIDGVTVDTKRAEMNLRAMFDAVVKASGGTVAFNLDVTAGRRFGYHYFCEYGNVFLENRYTDWANWYPTWTFRNIWQLAKYVPAERIQVEFLNNLRHVDKYAHDDELAPSKVPLATALCMTLAAQPLAWFEGSGLARNAQYKAVKELLAVYAQFSQPFHEGVILPVGDEPSGRSFSGFQSLDAAGNGWLIVVREATDLRCAKVRINNKPGVVLLLEPLAGDAVAVMSTVDSSGCIEISLPAPWSYGVWRLKLGN